MVKYVVRLRPEEREQLLALVNTGRAAAAKLLHARIALKLISVERSTVGPMRRLPRPWTPVLLRSIGCAKLGSNRAWRRR